MIFIITLILIIAMMVDWLIDDKICHDAKSQRAI